MNLTAFRERQDSQNPHYILFGHPVEHSWSPLMHNTALEYYGLDARYYAIDLQNHELNDLASFLNKDTFLGANITIPYKQMIADYLDGIDEQAQQMGAINTIVKNDYRLEGYNTDCYGFVAPLEGYEDKLEGHRAIVFGTGGASRAIVQGLTDLRMEEIYLVSRSPQQSSAFTENDRVNIISYPQWTSLAEDSILIVNATPLGMHPNTDQSPVRDSETGALSDRICYDIVYNPMETTFLQQAKQAGATTIGGAEMLIQQGSRSFELWTGKPFPVEIIRDTLYEQFDN